MQTTLFGGGETEIKTFSPFAAMRSLKDKVQLEREAKTYRIADRSISGSSGHNVVGNLRRRRVRWRRRGGVLSPVSSSSSLHSSPSTVFIRGQRGSRRGNRGVTLGLVENPQIQFISVDL